MWQRKAGEPSTSIPENEIAATPSTPPTPRYSPDSIVAQREFVPETENNKIDNTFKKYSSEDKLKTGRLDRFASNFAKSIRIL